MTTAPQEFATLGGDTREVPDSVERKRAPRPEIPHYDAPNSMLIALPSMLLNAAQRAVRYRLRVLLAEKPCPGCGRSLSRVEASGVPLDDWTGKEGEAYPYRCPGCGLELGTVEPFVGSLTPFAWCAATEMVFMRNVTPQTVGAKCKRRP